MLCQICNINEATIHIHEIVKGQKKALNICQNCADNKKIVNAGFSGWDISELLYNLSNQINLEGKSSLSIPATYETVDKSKIITCLNCSWDSEKFKKTGRLGCEKCYDSFSVLLSETLPNMHKGTVHTGKTPKVDHKISDTGFIKLDIINLQKKLEEHVVKEEYEKAAGLRDEISELKEKLNK